MAPPEVTPANLKLREIQDRLLDQLGLPRDFLLFLLIDPQVFNRPVYLPFQFLALLSCRIALSAL